MSFKYFAEHEFFCQCGCGLGLKDMDQNFVHKLNDARAIAMVPFRITSSIRCQKHNAKVSKIGSKSSHLKGCAVDLEAESSRRRMQIVAALICVNFSRIGIGTDFIHVDFDIQKTQQVMWHYF